jgi:hypothetical protein
MYTYRKMTLTETEQDRLWNGKQYKNLPEESDDAKKDMLWKEQQQVTHPSSGLVSLQAGQASSQPTAVPFQPTIGQCASCRAAECA